MITVLFRAVRGSTHDLIFVINLHLIFIVNTCRRRGWFITVEILWHCRKGSVLSENSVCDKRLICIDPCVMGCGLLVWKETCWVSLHSGFVSTGVSAQHDSTLTLWPLKQTDLCYLWFLMWSLSKKVKLMHGFLQIIASVFLFAIPLNDSLLCCFV